MLKIISSALGLALVAVHPAFGEARDDLASPATEIVPFQTDASDRMTVPVRIGDRGPFQFVVDTGAETTVLSHDVARRLGLEALNSAKLVSVAGKRKVSMVAVDELSFSQKSSVGLVAPVLDANHIGVDGIVGLDSLQDQRIVFDFARNRMEIDEPRRRNQAQDFEFAVEGDGKLGRLIMANALIDGVRTAVMIDTGSEISIGNRALETALEGSRRKASTTLMAATGQEIAANVLVARKINIQGLVLRNTSLAFADAPVFTRMGLENEPAMLLGMSQLRKFKRVAIDFASRRILFDVGEKVTFNDWPMAEARP